MSTPALALVANAGDGTVSSFQIADDRAERLAVSPVGPGCSTFAVDSERGLVYAASKDPLSIVTLVLDTTTGTLSPIATTPVEASMTYLELTAHGDRLVGASYGGGYAQCWPVVAGKLQEPGDPVRHPNLHSVAITKDTRHVYAVSLGADLVVRYELGRDGSLTDPRPAAAPAGSGPRHIALNTAETAAYVVTEFSAEVLMFARDLETGELTLGGAVRIDDPQYELGHSEYGANPREHHYRWGADIDLARNETHLWASERTESTIATVPLGLSGQPEVPTAYAVTETQPRGFHVSPDGRYLLCTGERSDSVSLYTIGADGSLTPVDREVTGRGANWVRFV